MTGRREPDERLRARLREAAGAHEPDRARILARIEHGMAAGDRGPSRPPQQLTPRPKTLHQSLFRRKLRLPTLRQR